MLHRIFATIIPVKWKSHGHSTSSYRSMARLEFILLEICCNLDLKKIGFLNMSLRDDYLAGVCDMVYRIYILARVWAIAT